MNKIFIFSTPYFARIILRCIEFQKFDQCEIILLSELGVFENVDAKFLVYNTLQQCVENCTHILLIKDEKLPKSCVDLVEKMAEQFNKRCLVVMENSINKANHCDYFCNRKFNMEQKPEILILSYGNRTQVSCWETIIYKFLFDNNFHVHAIPSNEFFNLMDWFLKCDLENRLLKLIATESEENEVVVKFFQYDTSNEDLFRGELKKAKPDIVILSLNDKHYDYNKIVNLFKYKYHLKIDMFVLSEFLEYDNEEEPRLLFNFSVSDDSANVFSLGDTNIIYNLSKIILPKISLPDGVNFV